MLLSRFSVSDSVQPHRQQPTRLPSPWDSPGKNSGVGCHFLLQCVKVKSESEVAQSCLTVSNPMDCSLPGSSVHGIFQARYWSGVPYSNICFQLICELKGMNRERVRWKHGHSNGNRVDEKCLPKIKINHTCIQASSFSIDNP